MKRLTDLTDYKGTLPYASEGFGVYQPLLGWKGKRHIARMTSGVVSDHRELIAHVLHLLDGKATLEVSPDGAVVGVASVAHAQPRRAIRSFGSTVLDEIAADLPPLKDYHDGIWVDLLEPRRVDALLRDGVASRAMTRYRGELEAAKNGQVAREAVATVDRGGHARQELQAKLEYESSVAGMLLALSSAGLHQELKRMFYDEARTLPNVFEMLQAADPFDTFDPTKQLDRVALSPIGIVHLFRQYFFEFDTFLGVPVGHVWLSPGSSVELMEISTRKTTTEKTIEIATESVVQSELATTQQDEISDAVKESNRNDIKFGANVSGHEAWVWGSADESASFDMNTTQDTAREQTHKQMRQQSQKLSSEIRKNYKSTFKTVTEVTDTSSKRYVLENTTDKLVNYELRRKMREVGVQVQDVGTYLCWQTYVDSPGYELGVSKLMHIAKSPDIDNVPHPETIEGPQAFTKPFSVVIPFIQTSEDRGDLDEGYWTGVEEDKDKSEGHRETIKWIFPQNVTCDQVGYRLTAVDFDTSGVDIQLSADTIKQDPDSTQATFTVYVYHINFKGQSPVRVAATLHWTPDDTLVKSIMAKNEENLGLFTARLKQEYKKEFAVAAKERIKLASKIVPRNYDELREEERIVVYRQLIQELLTEGIKIVNVQVVSVL